MTAKARIDAGVAPSDIAVLYRTNFQSRALEEAFLTYEIPYQLLGTKFFDRKEVKDVLSYLRLAVNPGSTADLARIANVPTRGLGKVTVLKLIEGRRADITGATAAKVERFEQIMLDIADSARTNPAAATLKFIIERSGLEAEYKKEGSEEALSRLENLRELVTYATRYDQLDPEASVNALLESAALASDQDTLANREEQDAVRLMSFRTYS
jgi:DNA helicase-2/ATP-dependent DNA helicase PcrA